MGGRTRKLRNLARRGGTPAPASTPEPAAKKKTTKKKTKAK